MKHRVIAFGQVRQQRGVVLLMSLIILTVLLAASIALVRSFDTTLTQAGNLAFKRDLANHAETAMPVILARFQGVAGALNTATTRGASNVAINYSARMLTTNAQGIPVALLNNAWTDAGLGLSVGTTGNNLEPAGQGVTIRYLVDRMCSATGLETSLGNRCVGVDQAPPEGSIGGPPPPPAPKQIAYRVSVRVDGPRNTQAFFQTVFSL